MTRLQYLILASLIALLSGCTPRPDVFYIISTNVVSSHNDKGKEIYNATLAPEDTVYMYMEKEFVRKNYAGKSRFYAPYYKQFTLNALKAPESVYDTAYIYAKEDMKRHFNDYMARQKNRRPFVFVGFSQGSIIALDLMKEMSDEQFRLCRGGCMMGYRITEEDMRHPRIKPVGIGKKGNIVSFNSVMSREAAWDFVSKGAATCTNPLNWKDDETPATLVFNGDTATVHVDKTTNQLIVTGLSQEKYTFPILKDFCKPGNLHHWDLLFYADPIKKKISRGWF